MANRKKHMQAGMWIAGIADTISQIEEIRSGDRDEFDLLELLIITGAGALAGIAADFLEPATSSWHRKAIHSVGIATLSTTATYHPRLKNTFVGRLLKSAAFAHCSHLLLDARTPRGIPWLHPNADSFLCLIPLRLKT
jgi:membrane-bound metal-dependent hydrolase YbcI (DUF457 family)